MERGREERSGRQRPREAPFLRQSKLRQGKGAAQHEAGEMGVPGPSRTPGPVQKGKAQKGEKRNEPSRRREQRWHQAWALSASWVKCKGRSRRRGPSCVGDEKAVKSPKVKEKSRTGKKSM